MCARGRTPDEAIKTASRPIPHDEDSPPRGRGYVDVWVLRGRQHHCALTRIVWRPLHATIVNDRFTNAR